MPNTCQIIITRGKNKGQACCEVNRKCRHKDNQCPHCGIRFTVETSYSRHLSQCGDKVVVKITQRPEAPASVPVAPTASAAPAASRKIKTYDTEHRHQVLLKKIEKLERELEVVKQTPAVQHHHWNIVLGTSFFDELVMKMGRDRAISFLSGIAQDGKPVDVISKLYLEGNDPTNYPIACRDRDHFRYIDSDHRLIDDKGGHGLSRIVTSGVHDALILAASEAPNGADILQKYVADMRKSLPSSHIISELAHMTSIPNHPFFIAPGEPVV